MKILGLDISPDHGGIVCLNEDGIVDDYLYLTTTKKEAAVDSDHAILLTKRQGDESKDIFRLRRMNEYLLDLANFVYRLEEEEASVYYSFEGYSYRSQSTSLCQIAELTGYLKHYVFEGGGKIRIHDPLSVKLFATNKGNASKKDVVEQALLDFDIPKELIKKKQIKKKNTELIEEYDGACTDLSDAYFLARMLHTELQLRSGELLLKQLSEGGRRIFLRVTKAYPVNILDRQFICKEEKKN